MNYSPSVYGGSAFVGMGVAAIGGAAVRFVRNALRIDDQLMHSAENARLASVLLGSRRGNSEAIEQNSGLVSGGERRTLLRQAGVST